MNISVNNLKNRTVEVGFQPIDNSRLLDLCGPLDENLRYIEKNLSIEISRRSCIFRIIGAADSVNIAERLLKSLYAMTETETLLPKKLNCYIQEAVASKENGCKEYMEEPLIKTRQGMIKGRSLNQQRYLFNIFNHDINFCIGPAGTGKTYLAVACAVAFLKQVRIRRIVLVRPAVEAGENLGFLPGNLNQKIDPYLRPLYDALYEMLGFEQVAKYIENTVIEVSPLAFMRGRTLNESFVILDEAQNTTSEQMKMFLTRIGYRSVVVVAGDITQTDLPHNVKSGLRQIINIFKHDEDISFTFFDLKDVVRHPILAKILNVYEAYEREQN